MTGRAANQIQLGPDRPTGARWLIFALACAVSWLLYLHRYAWGAVLPVVSAEFPQLTPVELGWMAGLFMAAYGVGQVPGGLAGDRLGPRAVLPAMIVAWSLCVAALGAAPGPWQLAAVFPLFGLAQAGAYPNLSQVTRRWFPPATRTTVQGVVASLAGRAGGACAPLLVATVLMGLLHLSWRQALLTLGAAGLLLGAAFALLFRNGPREHPWANEAERRLIEPAPPPPAGPPAPPRLTGASWTLTALLLYAFASAFADQLYVFWVPQFLVEDKRLSLSEMGVFAGLPLWGGAVGGALGGVLNDALIRATGSRRWGRATVALTGKLLAGALIALSVGVADGRLVMVVLLACKFFGDWGVATQWGTITDVAGRSSGTVFGLVNTAASVAAFSAGPAMGHLKQTLGWSGLFLAVAGVYVASALCWLFIDCTARLAPEAPGRP